MLYNTYTQTQEMITTEYLKELLKNHEEFSDYENQIMSGDGYDEITAILENIRTVQFPCVVLEERSFGNFSIEQGAVDTYTKALWIMVQQRRDEQQSNAQLYKRAFNLMKMIIRLMIAKQQTGAKEVASLNIARMPYNKREGGPGCLGYELLLTFNEDISLSDE